MSGEGRDKKQVHLRKEAKKCSKDSTKFFKALRDTVREEYWLIKTPVERDQVRRASLAAGHSEEDEFCSNLRTIKEDWQPKWKNTRLYNDFFHHYLIDQTATGHAWALVEEDVFIVTDKKRRVIFANIEKLGELLFGREAMDVLVRCLDMWKFFAPLPLPETCRHVVDNFIRRQHPELDPSAVTVEHLPNAVMAVAH